MKKTKCIAFIFVSMLCYLLNINTTFGMVTVPISAIIGLIFLIVAVANLRKQGVDHACMTTAIVMMAVGTACEFLGGLVGLTVSGVQFTESIINLVKDYAAASDEATIQEVYKEFVSIMNSMKPALYGSVGGEALNNIFIIFVVGSVATFLKEGFLELDGSNLTKGKKLITVGCIGNAVNYVVLLPMVFALVNAVAASFDASTASGMILVYSLIILIIAVAISIFSVVFVIGMILYLVQLGKFLHQAKEFDF